MHFISISFFTIIPLSSKNEYPYLFFKVFFVYTLYSAFILFVLFIVWCTLGIFFNWLKDTVISQCHFGYLNYYIF